MPLNPPGVSFELWDVFTRERYRGNPLAVFPDASPLPEDQLGPIAREMNQSETTFVYPGSSAIERRDGIRTRIYSRAGAEMPFAGHPVLGTAFALWTLNPRRTDPSGESILLHLPSGQIPVEFAHHEGTMLQPDPIFAESHDAAVLAPLLGLRADDLDTSLPLQNVSTGRPNIMVLVKSRAAVAHAAFDWRGLDAYFSKGDRERGFYLLTRDVESPSAHFHARKVTRLGDDPATGSAAGAAIAWLVRHGAVPPGRRVTITQGAEVHRDSELFASAAISGAAITNIRIGGSAILSASGTLAVAHAGSTPDRSAIDRD